MIKKKSVTNFFYKFLLIHLFIWTLVPALTNINLPLDTIEALAWGSNLDWGFNKHPPFSAFAVEIFYQIFGNQDWAYYFLSQLFIIISFFVVYKFSVEFFNNEKIGFLSVLLLEGIYFFNFTTPEFNVNVAQLPFWALSVYYTWRCIKYDKAIDYVFLGLFVGLGILSKYLFIYLVIGIKLVFIYFIKKGKRIKFSHYFIAGPITLIILLPHLIWLTENNYTTITYGLQRTGGVGDILDHFIYPLYFLAKQIGLLIPFVIMTSFLVKKNKFKINLKDEKLAFLILTIIVPIFFMLLTSIIMGAKIRTMWMTPFYLFAGTLIIYIFKSQINLKKLKNFVSVFLIFFFLSPISYAYVSITQKDKRTDYPGKKISIEVQKEWEKKFTSKIKYVIGDEWLAGNLSYHLDSRPVWLPTNSFSVFGNEISIVNLNKEIYNSNLDIMISDKTPVRLVGSK
ncbi:MAG: glycosyltransferase family 39 protein [Pelagibacteraceae bacterium]